jgi:hypothetical protein
VRIGDEGLTPPMPAAGKGDPGKKIKVPSLNIQVRR